MTYNHTTIKHWVRDAIRFLEASLKPVPHEINELDWKIELTANKDRTREHLIAFSNYSGGGYLAYVIAKTAEPLGVSSIGAEQIANSVANIGRDAIEPPLALDHAIVEFQGVPILLVYMPEHAAKPVHCRGKGVEETWIRSAGTTRKASRQEIASLMMHSAAPTWEEIRASDLLRIEQVKSLLDIGSIAKLLERPLPADADELTTWLIDEGIITREA